MPSSVTIKKQWLLLFLKMESKKVCLRWPQALVKYAPVCVERDARQSHWLNTTVGLVSLVKLLEGACTGTYQLGCGIGVGPKKAEGSLPGDCEYEIDLCLANGSTQFRHEHQGQSQ